jgi:hypothetical protein
VQPLLVVDLLYELAYVLLCFLEVAVVLYVDFLHLQRSEEAVGFGILVGVPHGGHADPGAGFLQPQDVLTASVLHALIGMVNQPRIGRRATSAISSAESVSRASMNRVRSGR